MIRAGATGRCALLAVLAWAAPVRAEAPLRYTVRADAGLQRLDVEVCFDVVPPALTPGIAAAGPALVEARGAEGRALPVARGQIDSSSLSAGDCLRYRVDLSRALSATRFAGRFGGDVMSSAGTWLWRPARIQHGGAGVRFELPRGIVAATPWPREGGVHHLDASAFQRPCFMAFTRATPIRFARDRAELEVVRLGEGWRIDDAGTERWLARVIDGVSTVQGRFPVDRLLVVMVPSGGPGVGFGMVRRGGGHSVAFVVGPRSSAEDLEQSWVPWHELSHLLLPALPQRDAWLYEGLATYYQEVLPARMGVRTPRQAWSNLLDGFGRGAAALTGHALREDAQTMQRTGAFSRVYWGGTAFVLQADVTLRRHGSSLDEALARAAGRWRGSQRVWSSERVCELLDGALLGPLCARYAASTTFPDLDPLLTRLGIRDEGGRAVLGEGPERALRVAITTRRDPSP